MGFCGVGLFGIKGGGCRAGSCENLPEASPWPSRSLTVVTPVWLGGGGGGGDGGDDDHQYSPDHRSFGGNSLGTLEKPGFSLSTPELQDS